MGPERSVFMTLRVFDSLLNDTEYGISYFEFRSKLSDREVQGSILKTATTIIIVIIIIIIHEVLDDPIK